MKQVDVIVVGGSAAGITAAITCRRHYPDKSVLLIRKDQQVPIPCGIPYIFGTLGSPQKNLIPDTLLNENSVEILVDEVTGIDRRNHEIFTTTGERFGYTKLVLATGSLPTIPPIPGVEMNNIFCVEKNVDHLQYVLDQLTIAEDLVIVGGGFIGVEFADECRKKLPDDNGDMQQRNITIIEMLSHCMMGTFDEDLCEEIECIEKQHGIDILTTDRVEAFVGNGAVESVRLASGKVIKANMVIVGTGSTANSLLAEKIGLGQGSMGGIQVDQCMRTSDPDIFACGDCVEKVSFFDGKMSHLKLASTATREARIAGANLFEIRRMNTGVIGVFSTVVGDIAFALAGLSVEEAQRKGFQVVVGEAEAPNRHPGCMPDMSLLKVRLVFQQNTGIILGGQIVGGTCSGELINVISACIHGKMTADDIAVFPMGTHPALTASPVVYQLTNAAEKAVQKLRERQTVTVFQSIL
jgi:NADH oxidase (H2O2-forming)